MKNLKKAALLTAPFLVVAFLLGFYWGRSTASAPLSVSELPDAQRPAAVQTARSGQTLININTANQYELMSLPGIGEELAMRIIQYRETNGPFPDPDSLLNVHGIGEGKLENILDLITTGG